MLHHEKAVVEYLAFDRASAVPGGEREYHCLLVPRVAADGPFQPGPGDVLLDAGVHASPSELQAAQIVPRIVSERQPENGNVTTRSRSLVPHLLYRSRVDRSKVFEPIGELHAGSFLAVGSPAEVRSYLLFRALHLPIQRLWL